jgi:hypothetical protein
MWTDAHPHSRYEIATDFAELIRKAARADTPCAAFTDQSTLWEQRGLLSPAEEFPEPASQRFSTGDGVFVRWSEDAAGILQARMRDAPPSARDAEPPSRPGRRRLRLKGASWCGVQTADRPVMLGDL